MARSRKANGKPAAGKRRIEQYDHKGQQRRNNPPVGLVTEATDRDAPKHRYAYDPHLDPTLTWAGKTEHTSFEVPTVSLHVHERIDPKTIVEAVRRRNGTSTPVQGSLFESAEENPPLREAIDFYQHAHASSNRLIAGDSLLVMNSLLEKEGMAGKVQMIYIDPPHGIRYGSNFQPFVNKRDVKDGSDVDVTQEPEMIRAFRLARNLKAEIDLERIEVYRGTVSLPFEGGNHKRVAVKIVDDRGIESLKIIPVS
jgi:adenine-specific DNA-methyltransferase